MIPLTETAPLQSGRRIRIAFIAAGLAFAIAALLNACGFQPKMVRINEDNLSELGLTVQGEVVDTGILFLFYIDEGYLEGDDFWRVSQKDSESLGKDSVFLRTGSREDIRIELRKGSRTIYSKTIILPDSNLIGKISIDVDFSVSTSWLYLPTEESSAFIQLNCNSISGFEYRQSVSFRRGNDRSRYMFTGMSSSGPGREGLASGSLLLLDTSDVIQSHDDSTFSMMIDFSRPLRNWNAQMKGCDAHAQVFNSRHYPTENVFEFEDISFFYSQRATSSIQLDIGSPGE